MTAMPAMIERFASYAVFDVEDRKIEFYEVRDGNYVKEFRIESDADLVTLRIELGTRYKKGGPVIWPTSGMTSPPVPAPAAFAPEPIQMTGVVLGSGEHVVESPSAIYRGFDCVRNGSYVCTVFEINMAFEDSISYGMVTKVFFDGIFYVSADPTVINKEPSSGP